PGFVIVFGTVWLDVLLSTYWEKPVARTMVLQVCVPPFRLGICAVPRISENKFIYCGGASEVARVSDLHIMRVDTIQFKLSQLITVGQERIHDELKGPNDAAYSGAYHHNQGGEQPVAPHRHCRLPRA
ncbi:MAG: hypothetical protein ACKPKO_09650, partial [Candidatus Fonsibacter sp.]